LVDAVSAHPRSGDAPGIEEALEFAEVRLE
jgi:hypothetical protein